MKHFLWTIPGPDSSYSSFWIHISWKVESEERIDPPIQTEYFRSGGATILTLTEAGAKVVISLLNLLSISVNIDVALLDRIVGQFVDTFGFFSDEVRLEEDFWGSESFTSNGDDLTVGKLVLLFDLACCCALSLLQLLGVIFSDIRKFFLHITDDFSLCGSGERVTSLCQDFHHVDSKITSCKIETKNSMRKSITFINWDGMRNTITGVENNTGGTSRSIQRKDSLDSNIHSRGRESFKHNLRHLFSVCFWVQWSFRQQNGVLFWGDSKLVIEGMMPDLFHVIPRSDDTVFNRIRQFQHTTLALCFIPNVRIFLRHTNH